MNYRSTHLALKIFTTFTMALLSLPLLASDVELVHIHGLGFSANGKQLIVPAHFGLAIYENQHWHKAPGPDHDYMGFSITANALYSSGHPAPGSNLVNPFGLKKSSDAGKTWQELGMQGEADFHVMATGYNTNTVYLLNMIPNSTFKQRGIYYTVTDGKQWQPAPAQGGAEPVAMAVHPDKTNTVALASRNGLFLSKDHGQHFKALEKSMEVYAVSFDFDGSHLYFAGYDIGPSLTRLNFHNGQRKMLRLPPLERDAVSYIAQNPANHQQIAIATFNRDVYLSDDLGNSWRKIARQGQTL